MVRVMITPSDNMTSKVIYTLHITTSQYLWKFHRKLVAPPLYLASLLHPPPPSNTPLEEACSACSKHKTP